MLFPPQMVQLQNQAQVLGSPSLGPRELRREVFSNVSSPKAKPPTVGLAMEIETRSFLCVVVPIVQFLQMEPRRRSSNSLKEGRALKRRRMPLPCWLWMVGGGGGGGVCAHVLSLPLSLCLLIMIVNTGASWNTGSRSGLDMNAGTGNFFVGLGNFPASEAASKIVGDKTVRDLLRQFSTAFEEQEKNFNKVAQDVRRWDAKLVAITCEVRNGYL